MSYLGNESNIWNRVVDYVLRRTNGGNLGTVDWAEREAVRLYLKRLADIGRQLPSGKIALHPVWRDPCTTSHVAMLQSLFNEKPWERWEEQAAEFDSGSGCSDNQRA